MGKYLLHIFFHNFPYKIAAVLLACIFWYIVQGEEILEVNRRLMVRINVPEGYAIKGDSTRVKEITLRGPRVLLGDASSRPLEAVINVPTGRTGLMRFRVDKEQIRNWDPRLRLTVHDAYITLYVDEQMTRRLQVREVLQGVPSDGYVIEKVSVKPNMVAVTGLKAEMARVHEVLTEPIDISSLQSSKSFEADLVPKGFNKSGMAVDHVTVNIQITEGKINRKFGNIPVDVEGNDNRAIVSPYNVLVVIQGTPGVLSNVKRTDLRAYIDAKDLAPGRYEKDIQIRIPSNTVLVETTPPKAMVEIFNQKKLD